MQRHAKFSFRPKSGLPAKPFRGEVYSNRFRIYRIIDHKNSFLPAISGKILNAVGETQIEVKMRLHGFVIVFMSVWLGITGLVCVAIFINALLQLQELLHKGLSPVILIPFAMFVFGCLTVSFAFRSESKLAKTFLASLLEQKEERK